MTRRRGLVVAAALGSLVAPLAGRSQPTKAIRRIGWLSPNQSASTTVQSAISLIRASLRRAGWEEGAKLLIEWRFAEGDVARLDALAQELVRLDPELIVANADPAIAAAKRATSRIPIVMFGGWLPVEAGFVRSLARPGSNITGMAIPGAETDAKSLQILKQAVPALTRLAVLTNPASPDASVLNAARKRAAGVLGMTIEFYHVTRPDEVPAALDRMVAGRAEMMLVGAGGIAESRVREITSFAIQHQIVTIGTNPFFPRAGGAMSYGPNFAENVDRFVSYIDRILRGARPEDLPVEEPTKFDLILNLKTMRAIGLTVPQALLLRADEVIE